MRIIYCVTFIIQRDGVPVNRARSVSARGNGGLVSDGVKPQNSNKNGRRFGRACFFLPQAARGDAPSRTCSRKKAKRPAGADRLKRIALETFFRVGVVRRGYRMIDSGGLRQQKGGGRKSSGGRSDSPFDRITSTIRDRQKVSEAVAQKRKTAEIL